MTAGIVERVIERPVYMEKLIASMGSDQVKIITGVRRCGKSFLLFNLFKAHLLNQGVLPENIIEMAFDQYGNKGYRKAQVFYQYAVERLTAAAGPCYVLLDEVQLLDDFAEILIDLISRPGVDVFVTGSNARLLSRDVVTEFRGRGREIRLMPLRFSEFMGAYEGDLALGYAEYLVYGGLPGVVGCKTPGEKADYLRSLYDELYITDIVERNGVRDEGNLNELIDVLSSAVGSLTNASKISASFRSQKGVRMAPETVESYIGHLEDAFLVQRAKRFDLKGRRYIGTPFKFYFTDTGLRNARMNFRQIEETHLMENVIFNELVSRGYGVDVGVVPLCTRDGDGNQHRSQLEIDFVCNRGSWRCYVQSAYALPTEDKRNQEMRGLLKLGDSFKKVVITKDGLAPHYSDDGVLMMNIYDFLLHTDSLER